MDVSDEPLGKSPAIRVVLEKVARLTQLQSGGRRLPPILIQGETGTGKGFIAEFIHRQGQRASGPFVAVNCAAIPEQLLEAEMFGFERGAFTDAKQPKPGLFQAAHHGTIFLDEVGLLSEAFQAKLLKVIEERAVRRLGSTRSEPVDVSIITATNLDLAARTQDGKFREDLYHRLAVLTLWLPPLRERGDDVVLLAEHLLTRTCREYGAPAKSFAPDARAALLSNPWKGNIRELSNVIERIVLLSDAPHITARMIGLPDVSNSPPASAPLVSPSPSAPAGDDLDPGHLYGALVASMWNVSRAAAMLGISRNRLRYWMERYGLRRGMTPPTPSLSPVRPIVPEVASGAGSPVAAVPTPARVRWERRRITLLRAALASLTPSASYTSWTSEVLVEKVQSFGGRVEELSPTGIVAAFGLEPIEDAPRHAAHAAMAILKAAERNRRDAADVGITVAIHVGQFLVGESSGAAQIDLDAKREASAVLEALLATTETDSIVVSESAATFLERRFDLTSLGVRPGLTAPVYRLAGRERSRIGPSGSRARFVGRRQDLDLLQSRLDSVTRGHGQIVGIVGEAGIGKSRLIFEFRHSVRQQPVTYLEGGCLSYASTVPFLPVLEILRQNFGIAEAHGPESIVEKVNAGLTALGLESEEWSAYLLQLLGVKEGTERLAGLSPEAIKSRTLEVMRQLSLRGSRLRPIVFVLEDLHWIDKSSEEVVASMVQGLAGSPVLFLATYRPGYRPSWMDKSYATQIALQPLSEEDSMTVVRSVLRTETVPDPLARVILDKADGNPFFLEEFSRAVRDEGNLPSALAVPDTIQDVLLARIHRLADGPKQTLQTAALFGREASLPLLRALWVGSDDALEEHLQDLITMEFLFEQREGAEPVYSFKHALAQEVAYATLSASQRQALHLAAGRALETMYADRIPDALERLAYHYSKTDEAEKAIEYLTLFARKAVTLYAHEEAVRALQAAESHVQSLPPGERDRRRLDLSLRHASSLFPLGRLQEILDLLLPQSEPLARLQDAALAGHYHFLLGRTYSFLADHERAAERAQQAIREADRCGDATTKGKAFCLLGQDGPLSGKARDGIAHGRQAVKLLEGTEERWWLGHAHWVVALNYLQIGSFAPALEELAQADAIAESTGDSRLQTISGWCSGIIHAVSGASDIAISECRRAVERSPDPLNQALATGFLGFAYMERGDGTQAIVALEQAASSAASFGYRPLQSWFSAFLAESYRIDGRFDTAREIATKSLQIATDARVQVATGWARLCLGRIANATGAHAEAEQHLKVALETFAGIQSRYEMGRTQLDLAVATHAQGRLEEATGFLRAAHVLFGELGLLRYAERAKGLAKDLSIAVS